MNFIEKTLRVLQTGIVLNEANLSSILRKINKDDNAIAMITSFRKENSEDENETYYEELKYSISEHGWGFLQMNGGWIEDKDNPTEHMVYEKSVFIETELSDENDLFKWGKQVCRKYNQDAFLFKSEHKPFGAYLKNGKIDFYFKGEQLHPSDENVIFKNKQETNIKFNTINFKDIEDMYSALKFGVHKDIKFIFESINERSANSLANAYSRKHWLLN